VATIGLVSLVVGNYDEAIAFFVDRLGFELLEDTALGPDKRWVVVAPKPAAPSASGAALLLAEASNDAERARVGDQTGGRVGFFLQSEDFVRDHGSMTAAGVHFLEEPRHEAYGTVAVFEDLYGNRWDLVQPAS
jgi:catechol 2,3-dioxygenase-like lactoylglutathione lyase family enzyme